MAVTTYFETGYGIDNPLDGTKFQWTGKDYVPYFSWSFFSEWYYDGQDSLRVLNPTTTYNLSDFNIGHEVSFGFGLLINNTDTPEYDIDYTLNVYRKNIGGSYTLQFIYPFHETEIPAYTAYAFYAGTGVDYDEEWDNIENMKYELVINGTITNTKIVSYTNNQPYSNLVVPQSSSGYLWVEGFNLCFTDYGYDGARYAKHIIRNDGASYSTGKNPGYMWIDTVNHGKICYIDNNGVERKTYQAKNYRKYNQLTTGKTPGYIWVSGGDSVGAPYSYINFIGYDGKHYCIMNGDAVGYEGNSLA